MPLFLDIEIPNVPERSGFITAPSVSTAASTASFMTSDDVRAEDDSTLLARLQGTLINAPPGSRPLRTGARVPTMTQIMAKQKAEKEVKAKAAEEKKLLSASRRIEMKAKQQEKISH
jgi:hypothetical protein